MDSRPQNAVSRAVRLKKDKAKSTAFLVAQIFSLLRRKVPERCPPGGANYRKISNGRFRVTRFFEEGEEGEMKNREEWMDLCRQASVEQDPKKLFKAYR